MKDYHYRGKIYTVVHIRAAIFNPKLSQLELQEKLHNLETPNQPTNIAHTYYMRHETRKMKMVNNHVHHRNESISVT